MIPADPSLPNDVERRHRRVFKAPFRERCDACGGPMTIKTRGRDQRAVCTSCQLTSSSCRCPRVENQNT